ncbi:MAG: glycosyltransferase family 4 protein [Pseudomonadota bacterium]
MSRIVIVASFAPSLVLFRGELIKSLVEDGHTVTALAPFENDEWTQKVEALGVRFVPVAIKNAGLNPFRELAALLSFFRTVRSLRPEIVLAYTIKPILFSGFSLLINRSARFVALVTGLGLAFNTSTLKGKLIRLCAGALYRLALWRADKAVFQNKDNLQVFLDNRLVAERKTAVVDGSGIDCDAYTNLPVPTEPISFLLVARLLHAKGVGEYIKAAQTVKQDYPDARFDLLGPTVDNPDGVSLEDLADMDPTNAVSYHGQSYETVPYYQRTSVYVLPSYHEGIPRTVLEAMSVGRPVLTTNATGCRETVEDGVNGFQVPVKDADALADKMRWFIEHPEDLQTMGNASRALALSRFDMKIINSKMRAFLSGDEVK